MKHKITFDGSDSQTKYLGNEKEKVGKFAANLPWKCTTVYGHDSAISSKVSTGWDLAEKFGFYGWAQRMQGKARARYCSRLEVLMQARRLLFCSDAHRRNLNKCRTAGNWWVRGMIFRRKMFTSALVFKINFPEIINVSRPYVSSTYSFLDALYG